MMSLAIDSLLCLCKDCVKVTHSVKVCIHKFVFLNELV